MMAVFVCNACDVAHVTSGGQPFCADCGRPMVRYVRPESK